jgi:hypothetical protein
MCATKNDNMEERENFLHLKKKSIYCAAMAFLFVRKITKMDLEKKEEEEEKERIEENLRVYSILLTYILSILSSLFLLNTHSVNFIQHSLSSELFWRLSIFPVLFCLFFAFSLNLRSRMRREGERETERERKREERRFLFEAKKTLKMSFLHLALSPPLYVSRKTNVSFMEDGNDDNMTFYSRLFSTIINAQNTHILLKSSSSFFLFIFVQCAMNN